MRRLKCLYEHNIAVIKHKVERYGAMDSCNVIKCKIKKKRKKKKETKRMFPQKGIEPESSA